MAVFDPGKLTDTGRQRLLEILDEGRKEGFENLPLLAAVALQETGGLRDQFDPKAVSPAGAVGTLQLKPLISKTFIPEEDPTDLRSSVRGGVRFLKELDRKYKGDTNKIVAAYNAGETVANQAFRGERSLPEETVKYRQDVSTNLPAIDKFLKEQQVVQRTVTQARRGADIAPEDAEEVVRVGGLGGVFAEQNRFHEIPFAEQERLTKQYIKRIQGALRTANVRAMVPSLVNQGVAQFREANLKDPSALVSAEFEQFAEERDFYNQPEARQKLLVKSFKANQLTNIAKRYPDSRTLGSQLKANLDLSLDERKTRPEVVEAQEVERERRLQAAVAGSEAPFLTNFGRSIFSGFVDSYADIPRAAGLIFQADAPQQIADRISAIAPQPTDDFRDSWANSLGRGIGFVTGMLAGGGLGAAAKTFGIGGKLLGLTGKAARVSETVSAAARSRLPQVLTRAAGRVAQNKIPFAMAGSAETVNQLTQYYETAEERGEEISPVRVAAAVGASGLIGGLDVVAGSVARLLPGGGRVAGLLDDFTVKYLRTNPRVASVLRAGVSEAGQEAVQGALSEVAGAFIREQNIDFYEAARQVAEEGSVGGVIGGMLGLIFPGRTTGARGTNPERVEAYKAGFESEAEQQRVEEPIVEEPVVEESVVEERDLDEDVAAVVASDLNVPIGEARSIVSEIRAEGLEPAAPAPELPTLPPVESGSPILVNAVDTGTAISLSVDATGPIPTPQELKETIEANVPDVNVSVQQFRQNMVTAAQGVISYNVDVSAKEDFRSIKAAPVFRFLTGGDTPVRLRSKTQQEIPTDVAFGRAYAARQAAELDLTPSGRERLIAEQDRIAAERLATPVSAPEPSVPPEPPAPPTPPPAPESQPENVIGRGLGIVRRFINKQFVSGGLLADYQSVARPFRKGKTKVAGLRDTLEALVNAEAGGNAEIANDLRTVRNQMEVAGYKTVADIPQADMDAMSRAIRGEQAAYDEVSDSIKPIADILVGRLSQSRADVETNYINPVRQELLARLRPELRALVGEPNFTSVNELRDAALTELSETLRTQNLPEDQLQTALAEGTKSVNRIIQDQFSLLNRIANFNDLSNTIIRGIEGGPETEAYIHRIFRMFTDPEFKKQRRADTEARNRMAVFIGQELKRVRAENTLQRDGETDQVYQDRLTAMGRQVVDSWLSDETPNYGLAAETSHVTALLRRKKLAPEVLEFLGEIRDPVQNYASTMQQITTLQNNATFAQSALRLGQEQGWAYTEPPGDGNYEPLNLADRQGFDVLQGVWVPKDLHEGFETTFKRVQPSEWVRQFHRLNYWAKWGLTVGSPPTGIRNFTFNLFGGLANQTLNPRAFRQAVSELSPNISTKKAMSDALLLSIKNGVVGESITAGQVNRAMDELQAFDEIDASLRDVGSTLKKPTEKLTRVTDMMRRWYVFGDDLGKHAAFTVERNRRAKARGLKPDDPAIIKESAEIVKNTWPTYRRAYPIAKLLRKAPVSAFPTFTLEMVRTAHGIAKQIQTDIRDPNPEIRKLGVQRLAGATAVIALTPAAVTAAALALGMDEQEHQDACNTTLNPWQDCETTLFISKTKDGYTTLDLKWLNPYTYLTGPLTALVNDKNANLIEATADSAGRLLEPFVQYDVMVKAIVDSLSNARGKIFNETDSEFIKKRKQAAHVAKAVIPKFAKIPGEFYDALMDVRDPQGRTRSELNVLANNLGWAEKEQYSLDSAFWGAKTYNNVRRSMSKQLTDYLLGENRTNPTRDIAGLARKYEEVNERVRREWNELQKKVAAVQRLPHGFTEANIRENLRAGRLAKERIERLFEGAPTDPLELSDRSIQTYLKTLKRARVPKEEIQAAEARLRELQRLFEAS